MKNIHKDNIDEIMFGLLEGDIQGRERQQLLQAIEADPEYAELWNIWQSTVVQPDTTETGMNTALLRKKTRAVVPLYIRFAAAAAIVVSAVSAVYLFRDTAPVDSPVIADAKQGPRGIRSLPSSPADTIFTIRKNDTLKHSREKFRYIASKAYQTKSVKEQPIQKQAEMPLVQQPVQQKHVPAPEVEPALMPVLPAVETTAETALVSADHLLVETESSSSTQAPAAADKGSLLGRLLGIRKIRIQNNGSSLSDKKLIIENKKYQIIAGF